jgi:23S rRNA-/tRNA-specific pseudouridylate synthase
MKVVETHIVPSGIEGIRVDRYTRSVFDIFPSMKSIRRAIKRGEIRIDGKTCMPNALIRQGQILELTDPELPAPKPFRIPLKVFYEDDLLAIVEKPPGIPVKGNKHRTIENALQFNLEPTDERDALRWPMPVHRLDTPTGGLLIVAKTSTGRHHQLRRHLAELGFPILGDRLYGIEGKILRSKGLFLWAVQLTFRHPVYQWLLTVRIDEAPKFQSLLKREKLRWERYNDA